MARQSAEPTASSAVNQVLTFAIGDVTYGIDIPCVQEIRGWSAVTRLPQLRIEIVAAPDITWRHIVASCAVPVAYPPVRIDGHLYCDGGFLSVMPVWAAKRYGVDRVIAVNVLPSAPLTALRATVRMVRLLAPREPKVEGLEVLRVGPPRMLGRFHDAIAWDAANIRRWIDRGQADAEALIQTPQFAAICSQPGAFRLK